MPTLSWRPFQIGCDALIWRGNNRSHSLFHSVYRRFIRQQRGKQGSVQQQGNTEARDARDDKEPTAEDMNTKLSRDTSGLKDTFNQEHASPGSEDSRDARDNKEAGSGSYK